MYDGSINNNELKKLLLSLTPIERVILDLRMGLFNGEPLSRRDVAIILYRSVNQVKEIELEALKKLAPNRDSKVVSIFKERNSKTEL